jgi:hypothetical protein
MHGTENLNCHVVKLLINLLWKNKYGHVLVTRQKVWIDNWIYWPLIVRKYK